MRRHLLPSFLSYLIVSLTLSIPAMILGETALSVLGIGILPPALSWGALLQSAQNVRSVALAPWLFIPGLFHRGHRAGLQLRRRRPPRRCRPLHLSLGEPLARPLVAGRRWHSRGRTE